MPSLRSSGTSELSLSLIILDLFNSPGIMSKLTISLLALASVVNAASLGDVKHVVLLMMENRSFQHVSVDIPAKYTIDISNTSCSNLCSTLVLWPGFEVLPILTCRSIRMVNLSGISKYQVYLRASSNTLYACRLMIAANKYLGTLLA